MKKYSVIAAADQEWGIGLSGAIPWSYKEDFLWFRNTTEGSTCFMGKRTYLELAELRYARAELLPGRKSVVISSSDVNDSRVAWCNDISSFEDHATESNFFIGGRGIYEFGLTVADSAYITSIPGDYGCDVKFPHSQLDSSFVMESEVRLSDDLKVKVYGRR